MNLFVEDSIWISDSEVKRGTWCSTHIDGMVKGIYKIQEKPHKITIVRTTMRKAEKDWQVIEDDLGVDTGEITVDTGRQQQKLQLFEKETKQVGKKEKTVPQNRIFTLKVCKNAKGEIFGIKILR